MMDDLISRQAALTEIRKDGKWLEEQGVASMTTHERELRDTFILREMPSAQRWIPCSERLPDEEGEYLVTFNDEWRGPKVRTIWYGTPFDIIIDQDKWVFYCDKEYGFEIFAPGKHIVAWIELPKPYNDEHKRGEQV